MRAYVAGEEYPVSQARLTGAEGVVFSGRATPGWVPGVPSRDRIPRRLPCGSTRCATRRWTYDLMHEVAPSKETDGRLYGQGVGTLTGRLSGTATWSNFPRLRAGFALPDARGVIHVGGR